jgi:hypothetical protein
MPKQGCDLQGENVEPFLSLWKYIGDGFGLFLVFACAAIVLYLVIRRFHSRTVNAVTSDRPYRKGCLETANIWLGV